MCINSFIVFSFYPFSIYGIYDFGGFRGLKNNTPVFPHCSGRDQAVAFDPDKANLVNINLL